MLAPHHTGTSQDSWVALGSETFGIFEPKTAKYCEPGASKVAFCMLNSVHPLRSFVPTSSDTAISIQSRLPFRATFKVTNKQTSTAFPSTVTATLKHGAVTDSTMTMSNPLPITRPAFTANIVQSTNGVLEVKPCEANKRIQISLRSNVKIFKRCSGLSVKIALTGLNIYQQTQQPTQTTMPYSFALAQLLSSGEYSEVPSTIPGTFSNGQFTVDAANLIGLVNDGTGFLSENQDYILSFSGIISSTSERISAARSTDIQAQTKLETDPFMCTSQLVGTIRISCLTWDQKSVLQSSQYPCADNTITVSVRPSIPLLSTCGTSITAQARPRITISGLVGISTPNSNALAVNHIPGSNSLQSLIAVWAKSVSGGSNGILTITLNGDTTSPDLQVFVFTLKNSPSPTTNGLTISVSKAQKSASFPHLLNKM